MLILAFRIQNFACGACNGYVTVRKRRVCNGSFLFYLGGGRPSEGVGGDPLTERSKKIHENFRPEGWEHRQGAGAEGSEQDIEEMFAMQWAHMAEAIEGHQHEDGHAYKRSNRQLGDAALPASRKSTIRNV